MRKLMDTKKFSPNGRLLWYAAAWMGFSLFCFSSVMPQDASAVSDQEDACIVLETQTAPAIPVADDMAEDVSSSSAPVFLMQGDCGADVFLLQSQLQSLGYAVGDRMGVYTQQTASAVRRFQLDSGFIGDGVCTAAVSYAIASLSDGLGAFGTEISEEEVCRILQTEGYWQPVPDAQTETASDDVRLRNALMLFQRTHGLYGSGEADYATLCALGMVSRDDAAMLLSGSGTAADAASFDLRCRLLAEALADYVIRYPAAYDLYTLTACAAVLCNRVGDARFPGGFDTVCDAGLEEEERTDRTVRGRKPDREPVMKRSRDLLLIRAAEDALRSHLTTPQNDAAHGALYVYPADRIVPEGARICLQTRKFVFFR